MKANDLLNEKEKGMADNHHSAIPGMMGLKTDQYFGTYKWSKDVAGHDGKKQTAPPTKAGAFKDAPVVGGYTKAERDMTKAAAKGKVTQVTPVGSSEHGVNKDSPISGKKLKESSEKEMLFYAKVPTGDKVYARPRDADHLKELQNEYKNSDIKLFDFNKPEIQDWLEARRINLRKFTKGMVQTMTKHAYENANVDEGGMPQSVIKSKQKCANMTDSEFANAYKDKSDDELKAMAWRHGYGKDSNHYVSKRNKGKPIAESADDPPMLRAIISRIMHSHLDILQKYGPEKVLDAAQDVADWIGDVDEIGTSDVSIAVNSVIQKLKHSHDDVEEDAPFLAKAAGGLGLGLVAAAGAPAIVGILGPLLGIPFAAYGAYSAAKMGMSGVEKLWDMATDKLGSSDKVEQYATAQIAKLPPEKAKAATAAIKQVAESKVKLSRNYAGKKLNEVNPHDFDSDIDYYNALKAPSRKQHDDDYELPDAGPSEEDMAHDRQLNKFRKAQETAPKQTHKQEDGIAPNGEKYNTVVTFSGPDATRNKHGADSYKEYHWGAKKVVDTKQGHDSYTLYVVDNHRRGYWKPWEDQPAFESKLVELGYNSGYNFNSHKDYAKPSMGSDMSYNWNGSGANAYGIDSKLGGHGDPRAQKRKQGYQLKQSPSEYGDTDAPKSTTTKTSSRLDSLKQQYTDLVSKMHAISGDESKKTRLAQYRTQIGRLEQAIRVEDGGPSWLRRFTESKQQVADLYSLEESFVKKNSKIYNTK